MSSNYVVIGGASPGIGTATVRRLSSLPGAHVYVSCDVSDEESLAGADFSANVSFEIVDHGNRSAVIDFIDNKVPAEIRGVAITQISFEMEAPEDFDFALWDQLVEVNLSMPNAVIHRSKPKLAEGGAVVVVTSTEGFVGSFGASAYAASKAAIHNLVMTHANNLGSRGVRVNALAAGWIGGVMDTDEVFNMSRRITPLGRLGKPEEVAAAVNFLLSQEASFVNGTVMTVDGGYRGVDTIAKYEFEDSA